MHQRFETDADAEIGNEFREELPPFEFGRVAARLKTG